MLFEDGKGGAHFLSSSDLSRLLIQAEPFKFVFVSACYSQSIGQAFVNAGVKHVVCCEQDSELNHSVTADFTFSFYDALSKDFSVKLAFRSARNFVAISCSEEEADKYKLLPENEDHDIPIFDADLASCSNPPKEKPSIPTVPAYFFGREKILHEVVYSLLSLERLVTLVGEEGTGRSSLASAACSYIKERISAILTIDAILYVKGGKQTSFETLLCKLREKMFGLGVSVPPSDASMASSICSALQSTKMLLVFDGVDSTDDSFRNFLCLLFEETQMVRVLAVAHQPTSFLSASVTEKCIAVKPLSLSWAAKLFARMCPFADTLAKRQELETSLTAAISSNQLLCESTEKILAQIRSGIPAFIIRAARTVSVTDYNNLFLVKY